MKAYSLVMAMLLAVAVAGCTQKGSTEDEHAHDENLQLTAYGNYFEVFAEATPFVVGQTSDILAHFSFLNNFKPLTSGKITASLIVGTDGIRQTLENPSSPGIYKFSLKPVKAGVGKIVFDVQSPEINSQVVIPNIRVYDNGHDAQHDASDAVVTSSNGAVFTKEQSWKVDFATEEVRCEPFGGIIRTVGQIQPSTGDERVVSARTSGIVTFSSNNVVDGKAVSAGQSLFTIDASGMADNNLSVRVAEAQNEYNRAKAEFERKSDLAKDNIVSQSELLRAKTDFDNAQANYNNLRRNFGNGSQSVSSPISGYITSVLVRNGQFAEAGQTVLTVSQNQNLFVKAEIRPKHFQNLSEIATVNFRMLDKSRTYTLEELDGKLVSFGKSTDLANPLIPVVFQINNRAGLLSGSFIEMFIKTQSGNQAIAVTNDAVVEEMGNYFVYVQLTPEFFEKRLVKKGGTDGVYTEILDGLNDGERVVSKGAILVKLAQSAGAVDAHSGHVH